QMRSDGEGKPHVHPATVVLDRSVQELLDLREIDDRIKLATHLVAPHAQDGAVEIDVVPAGQFRMEPSAHLQQATDSTAQHGSARRGFGDAGKNLKQRAFASAIATNDSQQLATVHVERNILEGPDLVRPAGRV